MTGATDTAGGEGDDDGADGGGERRLTYREAVTHLHARGVTDDLGGASTRAVAEVCGVSRQGAHGALKRLWQDAQVRRTWGSDPDTGEWRTGWAPLDAALVSGYGVPYETITDSENDSKRF
jgi:hypothetical protein